MPPIRRGTLPGRTLFDGARAALHAARRSVTRRTFAMMAVTLALGVGTTAAVIGAADRVLFRPLPFDHGERLAAVYEFDERNQRYASTSYQDFLDYQRRLSTFDDLQAYIRLPLRVTQGGNLTRVGGEATTSSYFELLRVRPIVGRTLAQSTDADAWPLVTMISERLWHTRFADDPAIVGRTLVAEGQTLTIVGVVTGRFTSPNIGWGQRPDVWFPMEAVETLFPAFRDAHVFADRNRDSPFDV
jgi:putative ABC transport system permease protein